MILIDTTAWVEFLRDTGSNICVRVDLALIGDIAVCDVIRMEVLAGAHDERHLEMLRRLLAMAVVLPTEPVHITRLRPRCSVDAAVKAKPCAG